MWIQIRNQGKLIGTGLGTDLYRCGSELWLTTDQLVSYFWHCSQEKAYFSKRYRYLSGIQKGGGQSRIDFVGCIKGTYKSTRDVSWRVWKSCKSKQAVKSVFRIRIRNGSEFNQVSGSGSRRAKTDSEKKTRNCMFWSAGCFFWGLKASL